MKRNLFVFVTIIISLLFSACYVRSNDGVFEAYKEDFETINNLMLNIELNKDELFLVTFEDTVADIYNFPIELNEKQLHSLKQINNAFFGYDFSQIEIIENRISYGGEGYVMYIYSKDGKKPKYFYYEGDKVRFSTEYLGDNWYYLHTNYR